MIEFMKRSKEDAAQTRETVLGAARLVFERKGFARATLDDIAKAAKVTRGAIYHHFKNKDEVYQTLLLESGRKSMTLVPAVIAEGGTTLQIVERLFTRQLLQLESDPVLRAEALFALRGDYAAIPGVSEHVAQAQGSALASLTQAFAEGQAEGAIRADIAPRDLARAYVALQNGLITIAAMPGHAQAIQESTAALGRVLVAGFAKQS